MRSNFHGDLTLLSVFLMQQKIGVYRFTALTHPSLAKSISAHISSSRKQTPSRIPLSFDSPTFYSLLSPSQRGHDWDPQQVPIKNLLMHYVLCIRLAHLPPHKPAKTENRSPLMSSLSTILTKKYELLICNDASYTENHQFNLMGHKPIPLTL